MMRKALVVAGLAALAFSATTGVATASTGAGGVAAGSPGVLSGDVIEVPVEVPVNVCGDSIDVIGLLNPAMGDTCANG